MKTALFTKGRASWTWQQMHAQQFAPKDAAYVIAQFDGGGKLHSKRVGDLLLLRNSAGCFIHSLIEDSAPYAHS